MGSFRLVALAASLAFSQQPPFPASAPGLVVGRVIDAGSGRPIAGAIVTIAGPPPRGFDPRLGPPPSPPRILTGTDGRFVFRDLAAGDHNIRAIRAGYAEGAYGRRRPGGPSRPLRLDAGERRGDVTIEMWRYGAITGTVVDEAGEPAVGLTVRALRSSVVAGKRRFGQAIPTITDDRGIYRFGNLQPGEYLVVTPIGEVAVPLDYAREMAAGPGARARIDAGVATPLPGTPAVIQARDTAYQLTRGAVPSVANDGRIFVYPTTWYPSATAARQATPTSVASGEERLAVDLQLTLQPTVSVSGTLIGPDGPRSATPIRMMPGDGAEMVAEPDVLSALTNRYGMFTFPAVPIGHYTIRVNIRPPTASGAVRSVSGQVVNPLLWADVPVSAGRSDISGLAVTLRPGLRVSGRVEFEGSARRPFPNELQQVPVVVEPSDGETFLASPPAALAPSGEFTTTGHAPGRYLLRIGNSPTGWMFKSATLAGQDISDVPFDLDDNVSGVVITFTNRWTGVQGSVRTRQGAGDGDATVVAFPTRSETWSAYGATPRRLKSARTTNTGAYAINSLPPGDYFVAAIPEAYSSDWQDPAFLQALSRGATRVTIYEGEKATQNLVTRDVR